MCVADAWRCECKVIVVERCVYKGMPSLVGYGAWDVCWWRGAGGFGEVLWEASFVMVVILEVQLMIIALHNIAVEYEYLKQYQSSLICYQKARDFSFKTLG